MRRISRNLPVSVSLHCLSILLAFFLGARAAAQPLHFLRGDANTDGKVDISDPVAGLSYLFLGGAALGCMDAADATDDGQVDVSDSVRSLNMLFLGGPPLPAPGHETCGPDLSPDDLGCAQYPHCPQPPREAARVVLGPDPLLVPVGGTGLLEAAVLDAEGSLIEGAPIRFVSSSSSVEVGPDGMVRGTILGLHSVTALSGAAASEPAVVVVYDPLERETAFVSGVVSEVVGPLPGGGDHRAVRVLSPLGSVLAGGDGSFTVERLKRRNQILLALDGLTGALLWMGIVPGVLDEAPSEEVALGPASTAEALVFLTPGLVHPDPSVLLNLRELTRDDPRFQELEATLEALGPTWPARLDVLGPVLENILSGFRSLLPAPRAGLPRGLGGDLPPFDPVAHPSYTGGILVTPLRTSTDRIADIKVENVLVRQVDVYLEKVNPGSSEAVDERGPFQMGSATSLIPSIWQVLTGKGRLENDVLTIPGVDFDPARGGSREWRVLAYGCGIEERLHPNLSRESLEARLIPVLIRSFLLDVAFNVLSILTTLDFEAMESVVRYMRLRAGPSAALQTLINGLAEGAAVSELVVAALDFLTDLLADILESDGFKELLEKLLKGSAQTGAKEVFEKLVAVIEVWSLLSSAAELVGFGHAFFNSSLVEIIRIDDGPGRLEPPDGFLPTAYTGCPYETELRMVSGEGPFSWRVVGQLPESITLLPLDGPEFRRAKLRSERVTATKGSVFDVVVEAPFDPREPESLLQAGSSFYTLPVEKPAPIITAIAFPAGPGVDPGGTVNVDVTATHCLDSSAITGGTVSGAALAGPAPLAPAGGAGGTVKLTAVLNARKPLQDQPLDPLAEQLAVTVTDVNGGSASGKAALDVRNVAPSRAESTARHHVLPGGSFQAVIEAQDDNEDGTRPEVLASAISLSHPAGLDSSPRLDDLQFRRSAADPGTGEMTFEGRSAVTVDTPHADNDGPTEDPGDDQPFAAEVSLADDNGAPAKKTTPLEVVVLNAAPVIDEDPTATPAVLPALGTVAARPLAIRVHVTDDNGFADIGRVVLNLASLGYAEPVILTEPMVLDADGRGGLYRWSTDNVEVDCKSGCPVIAEAFDKDDAETNGGRSGTRTVVVLEENLPPVIGGDAILEFIGPTGGGRCPGDPMLFGIMASDPNGNALAADLILDGVRIPLAPSPTSPNIWKAIIPAPGPGVHNYSFEIREIDVFMGALTTSTAPQSFEVEDCQPSGDTLVCPDALLDDEVCDGVDNDCNGETDEGLSEPCGVSLHSGQFTVEKVPICPGDPVTYRVAAAGKDHPYLIMVEWTGPETGSLTLTAEKDAQGRFTGHYKTVGPAPGTLGDFDVQLRPPSPSGPVPIPYPLKVTPCVPLSAAPDSFTAPPGIPTPHNVSTNDAFSQDAAFVLVTPPAIHASLFRWNGDGTFTLAPLSTQGSVTFEYKIVDGERETPPVRVTVSVNPQLLHLLPVFIDPDSGEAKVLVPSLLIGGRNYPLYQLRLTNNPQDVCQDPHWHTYTGVVYALEAIAVGIPDPNPGSCGLGIFQAVVRTLVAVAVSDWLAFLEIHQPFN